MKDREALEYLFGLALFNADEEQHKKCREANKLIQEDLEKLQRLREKDVAEMQFDASVYSLNNIGMEYTRLKLENEKLKKDLEILEILKNKGYYVVEDEGLYRITFSLNDYELDNLKEVLER